MVKSIALASSGKDLNDSPTFVGILSGFYSGKSVTGAGLFTSSFE